MTERSRSAGAGRKKDSRPCIFFFSPVDAGVKEGMMQTQLIESNPSIMMGKPVIAGTRITVELILEKLAAGESPEQIIAAHSRLTREAVSAALDFAAKALRADVIYPTPDQAA